VILDVGCGVASFGGYLLDKNVITMSFAPKDEHEAQIQFALERGIPAFLSVIGTHKLPFPDNSFDMLHCARCRVHWEADGIFFSHRFSSFNKKTSLVKFSVAFYIYLHNRW
jgi:Putative S-adenosyl-L-methionine-dependent methyltransferase